MAKMPWLKLYTEIRTDPKMQALSDLEFRAWINIMCLSAESKVRGVICIDEGLAYPVEGLARALLISIEDFTSCIEKFIRLRMIDVDPDGIITLIHFDDRQYDKPSDKPEEVAKRGRKHREGKINANKTLNKREKNAIEEDKEKEGDIEKELVINDNNNRAREEIELNANDSGETVAQAKDNRPMAIGTRAVNWAEKNWGRMIPKGEVDSILAHCDEFSSRGSPEPDDVVIEALKHCLDADARNMHYLRAVLTDWREAGVLTLANVEAREVERKRNNQKDHKRGNKDPANKASPGKYEKFYL